VLEYRVHARRRHLGARSGRTFAQLLDQLVAHSAAAAADVRTGSIEDLLECVPGFGVEVADDGTLVDVRGPYHPGWCAPRVASSKPAACVRRAVLGTTIRGRGASLDADICAAAWIARAPIVIEHSDSWTRSVARLHKHGDD